MTTEDSTLIIEADLQCEKCYKKIHEVLLKLQSKENIKKICYENTKNKVTIVGGFDNLKLSKELRCKGCHVINITIVKPPEEQKPKEKKPEEEKQPEEKKSSRTVNMQFTKICGICYPWTCSDPAHRGAFHHLPQWPPCGMLASAPAPAPPVHTHPQPPYGGGPQKWAQCGGPPFCGGCAWCHSGGGGSGGMNCWVPPLEQPMSCPGPSLCRGCNGCKIVRETKFSYEEYPNSACAIM